MPNFSSSIIMRAFISSRVIVIPPKRVVPPRRESGRHRIRLPIAAIVVRCVLRLCCVRKRVLDSLCLYHTTYIGIITILLTGYYNYTENNRKDSNSMEIEKMKRRTIHRLKEIKAEQGLSIPKIMEMLEARGQFVSEPTLKKIFQDGSEEKNFRYQDTIMPVADVLLDIYGDKSGLDDAESLRNIIREKNKFIELLMMKLEEQASEHKQKEEMYKDRKAIYEKQIEQLGGQIARYEKAIDRKDDLIERLLDATISKE